MSSYSKNNFYKEQSSNGENNTREKDADDIFELTEDDKKALNLLDIQKKGIGLFILSDILSYIATEQSIDVVYAKYEESDDNRVIGNPDKTTVIATIYSFIGRIMFINIAFSRYNDLYIKAVNGEIKYSLLPNLYINTANVLGIITQCFSFLGAIGIYERDLIQPVFGIR